MHRPAGGRLRFGSILAAALVIVAVVAPAALADGTGGAAAAVPVAAPRIAAADPLNGVAHSRVKQMYNSLIEPKPFPHKLELHDAFRS